mgnify:CR=1 FL=1
MEPVKISVYSLVGNSFCVSAEDGKRVYEKIKEALVQGKNVELSFLNVELLTSAFLNTAVGMLYGDFSEDKIKSSLSLSSISNDDKLLLKRVVDTAKTYYKDPERLNKTIEEILGE